MSCLLFSICTESTSQQKEGQAQPVKVQTKQKPAIEEVDTKASEPEKDESEGKDDFLMNLWSTLKCLTVQVFLFLTLLLDTHKPC